MLSRRALVGRLAAGSAAVWAAGLAFTRSASAKVDARRETGLTHGEVDKVRGPEMSQAVTDAALAETASAPAPWEMLHPLTVGSEVGQGWRVSEFQGVVDGSCVLTLANERGRAQRIHVCRNDG